MACQQATADRTTITVCMREIASDFLHTNHSLKFIFGLRERGCLLLALTSFPVWCARLPGQGWMAHLHLIVHLAAL
jgi:hypothetical protein